MANVKNKENRRRNKSRWVESCGKVFFQLILRHPLSLSFPGCAVLTTLNFCTHFYILNSWWIADALSLEVVMAACIEESRKRLHMKSTVRALCCMIDAAYLNDRRWAVLPLRADVFCAIEITGIARRFTFTFTTLSNDFRFSFFVAVSWRKRRTNFIFDRNAEIQFNVFYHMYVARGDSYVIHSTSLATNALVSCVFLFFHISFSFSKYFHLMPCRFFDDARRSSDRYVRMAACFGCYWQQ